MKFLLGIAITSLFGVAAANAGTMGNGKFRMADATAGRLFCELHQPERIEQASMPGNAGCSLSQCLR